MIGAMFHKVVIVSPWSYVLAREESGRRPKSAGLCRTLSRRRRDRGQQVWNSPFQESVKVKCMASKFLHRLQSQDFPLEVVGPSPQLGGSHTRDQSLNVANL